MKVSRKWGTKVHKYKFISLVECSDMWLPIDGHCISHYDCLHNLFFAFTHFSTVMWLDFISSLHDSTWELLWAGWIVGLDSPQVLCTRKSVCEVCERASAVKSFGCSQIGFSRALKRQEPKCLTVWELFLFFFFIFFFYFTLKHVNIV